VIVCVLGRKAGKTTGVQAFIELAVSERLRVAWYAHVSAGSALAFEVFKSTISQSAITYKNETEGVVRLVNGSSFKFGTLKNPDNERGPNYDIVVLDEGAQISTYARDQVVSPMVADSKRKLIVVLTTPKGKRGKGSWVYRDFERARNHEDGYFYIKGATEENPSEDVREWAAWARENSPADMIREELDAEFLESGFGTIDFRQIAINGGDAGHPVPLDYAEEIIPPEPCIVGLDPARLRDWFACAAIGVHSRRLRALMRFQRMEWPAQIARAAAFYKRYAKGYPARVDTTGMGGDSVGSMLNEAGVTYEAIDFSKKATYGDKRFDVDNKTAIVQGLQVSVERQEWSMPWIEELISEGDTFEAELLPSNRIRYRAAEGFHDDLVIAVGLAVTARHTAQPSMGVIEKPSPYDEHEQDEDAAGNEILEMEI